MHLSLYDGSILPDPFFFLFQELALHAFLANRTKYRLGFLARRHYDEHLSQFGNSLGRSGGVCLGTG